MIKPKSLIIGIAITIFLIKYFEYYLFESELLSSVVYIVTFSFLYEMISNFFNKEKKVVEGYSTNSEKKVHFEDFEPSDTFKGNKPGYVFKKGNEGLGYYLDSI